MKEFFTKKRNVIALCVWGALLLALIAGLVMICVLHANGAMDDKDFSHRLFYCLLCFIMMSAVYLAEWILRIRLSPVLELSLSCFAFMALAMGTVFAIYTLVPFWDKVLHTTSGALFSTLGFAVALLLLKNQPQGKRKVITAVVIAFLFSLAVGYLWEIYEYTVDSIAVTYNCQRWQAGIITDFGDGTYLVNDRRGSALHDTMGDIIVNLIGTVVYLIPVLIVCLKKPERIETFRMEILPRRKKKQQESEE